MFLLFGFLGLLLLAGGAVMGLFAWRNLRTTSLLGRPLSRIGKLRPGCRKVRGKVVPLGKVLRGPVTNKECVYYRLNVSRDMAPPRSSFENDGSFNGFRMLGFFLFGGAGWLVISLSNALYKMVVSIRESTPSWGTLLDDAISIPVAVEDDTARVEVDLHGALVTCKEKSRIATAWGVSQSVPAKLTKLLREEYGVHTVDDRGRFKTLHIVEEALLAGATVTVVGMVETLEDGSLCFQRQGGPLVVSQRDMAEERRSARNQAIGFTLGAAAALGVGLGWLLGAFVLIVRASLFR